MMFSQVLASMQQDQAGGWIAQAPEDWLQGRSAFGGLQAAFALHAMRALLPQPLPLRVFQTTFMAPVPAGAVRIQARLLRQGKSVTYAEARLLDGEQTLCLCVGVFGCARESVVTVTPQQAVVENPKAQDFPYIAGAMPSFTQNFQARWLRGGLPFSGSRDTEVVVQLGLRDTEDAITSEAHVLALADFIPPLALSFLKKFAAGSSMTWTLEMLDTALTGLPLQNWRVDATLTAGRDGYTSQSVMLWGPGGVPVALSRQSMVVFG